MTDTERCGVYKLALTLISTVREFQEPGADPVKQVGAMISIAAQALVDGEEE